MSALNLIFDIGKVVAGDAALNAVNNYLSTSTGVAPDNTPQIPTKRKSKTPTLSASPKSLKKDSLSKYSGALAGVAAAIGIGAELMKTNMSNTAVLNSTDRKTSNDIQKAALPPTAPLLRNQLELKEGVNDLVDAINANTIAGATFLAPISSNLSAISSTLLAISSTLLEISDNYSSQIESSNDLPFIDSDTFYDLLIKQGGDSTLIHRYQSGEKSLVANLIDKGASYTDIKQAITDYRTQAIPSDVLMKAEAANAGLTSPKTVDANGTPTPSSTAMPQKDYSSQLERMAQHADSAKTVTDFLQTQRQFVDSDGDVLHNLSPMEVKAQKDAQHAKRLDDENTIRHDDTDFPSFDLMPTLPFIGRSSAFDSNTPAPSTNSFLDILKSKFSSLFSAF